MGQAFAAAAALVLAASCGSRTGLFVDGSGGLDATLDPSDAGASRDAPTDTREEAAVPCVPGRFDLDRGFAQLVFVIDRSGSMDFALGSDANPLPGTPSRWQALRAALVTALTPFDQEIAFGAKFFPEPFIINSGIEGCTVDLGVAVPPKLSNVQAVLAAYDQNRPRGGTPTAEAMKAAAELVKAQRGVARTLVVATDGAPNCNDNLDPRTCVCTSQPDACNGPIDPSVCLDDKAAIAAVQEIADVDRIPVYVLGIGGSANVAFTRTLDGMAVAGGRARATTPRYYPAQSPDELATALASIRDSIARCTFLTPSAPTDPDQIQVVVGGAPVLRDPTRTNGWDWVDQSYGQLAFFGTACDAVSQPGGGPGVQGVVTCGP